MNVLLNDQLYNSCGILEPRTISMTSVYQCLTIKAGTGTGKCTLVV